MVNGIWFKIAECLIFLFSNCFLFDVLPVRRIQGLHFVSIDLPAPICIFIVYQGRHSLRSFAPGYQSFTPMG